MRFRPALLIALACATTAAAAGKSVQPSAQAQALARAVRDGRAEAKGVEAQIAHLKAQLVALAAVEAAGERGTGDKKSRLDHLNAEEQALTAKLGEAQNTTARLLGVLALFRRDPPPALLVHPQSAKDAVRAQILARAIEPALQEKSRVLAADLDRLHLLRRQVNAASEDLFASQSAVAEQRAEIERLIADRTALERSLMADADKAMSDLRVLAAKSGTPVELLGRLPSVEESLGPPPVKLLEPVQGRLAARFGQSVGRGGPTEGFTWKSSPGAPVLAPAAGIVEYAGPLKDYGLILILRTGGAYRLVLTGLGAVEAVPGRTVAAGEPVGRMAEDEGPGPSLYLEVRKGGETVDPARWFKTAAR